MVVIIYLLILECGCEGVAKLGPDCRVGVPLQYSETSPGGDFNFPVTDMS